MPELPEVETVRRTLAPAVGATITDAWSRGVGLHMQRKPPLAALEQLAGATITAIRRHGKYLLVDTDAGKSILVHLGMTGRLRVVPSAQERDAHTHVVIGLGGRQLRYADARRFGQVDVVDTATALSHASLAVLGPDALNDGVDPAALLARAKGKKALLKTFLLDQSVVAGVGNIYASEALWRAKLRPSMRAHRLTAAKARALAAAITETLTRSLENHGTTLRDFIAADGSEGNNKAFLWVYDRDGLPCPRCKTTIKRTVHQGRATYYCPTCQAA